MKKTLLKKISLQALIGFGLCAMAADLGAFAPSTGAHSFEQASRPSVIESKKFHFRVNAESSVATRAYNTASKRVDVTNIYDANESTIMMLRNPLAAKQAAADLMLRSMGNPADDGVRGHAKLTSSYSEMRVAPNAGVALEFEAMPGTFGLDVHVPVVRKKMTISQPTDLTNTTNRPMPQDLLTAARMPAIPAFLSQTGGLGMNNITTTGMGDTVIMGSWRNWFRQEKDLIKGVELFAQIGISLPTGTQRNEDEVASFALGGGDGAFGIPVGMGLNIDFINTIRAGLNIDFLAYLDKSRERRMKTNQAQTELFLFNKGLASRDHGLNWQFYLYLQSYHFVGGLSAKAAYQYQRHDADKLTPRNNDFSYDVINASKRLDQWHAHNLIFSLDYDFKDDKNAAVVPQIGISYKLPVGGKQVIALETVGCHVGFNF